MKRKKKKIQEQWFFKSNEHNKQQINSNSWFNINILKNNDYVKPTYQDNDPKIDFLKTKVINIHPTQEQRTILFQWMNSFIRMYNSTNRFINNNIYNFEKETVLPEEKEYLNFRKLRTTYLKEKKEKYCLNNINTHLLDQAISHCVSKHKSAITNFKAGHNKFFRLRKMKDTRRKKILILEGGMFSKAKNGFCTKELGVMKSSKENKKDYKDINKKEEENSDLLKGINKTSILQYDKHLNTFKLYVPVDDTSFNINNRTKKCGIDP